MRRYGLFTAIAMIAGIVIGSGIFFKADDVLLYTSGSVTLGIAVFAVAAVSIIFGSLTVSTLASRSDGEGGIIAFAQEFVSPRAAAALGWFQMFLYYPSLIAVVGYVAGMYACSLFDVAGSVTTYAVAGAIISALLFTLNFISPAAGGAAQNTATVIKLIPLVFVAAAGLIFGNSGAVFDSSSTAASAAGALGALAPVAFAFDGWIVATTICHEIKNAKRNLPLAMLIAPIVVLACYLLYFVGLCSFIGVDAVMELGNNAPFYAANSLIGTLGARVLTLLVTVSVLGTLNGLILAYLRVPHSLTVRRMLPSGVNRYTAVLLCALWCGANFTAMQRGMAGDVSEMIIAQSYGCYIILYAAVFGLWRKGQTGAVSGVLFPLLATLGAAVMVFSSANAEHFPFFLFLVGLTLLCGFFYVSLDKAPEGVYNLTRGEKSEADI